METISRKDKKRLARNKKNIWIVSSNDKILNKFLYILFYNLYNFDIINRELISRFNELLSINNSKIFLLKLYLAKKNYI